PRLVHQTPQRKRLRRIEIPDAVFVVNGERLGRLTMELRRTATGVEDLPPAGGGLVEFAYAPPRQRQSAKALQPNGIERTGRRAGLLHGAREAVARAIVEAGARIGRPQREHYARIARRGGTDGD